MPRDKRVGSRRGFLQEDGRMSKNRIAWMRLVIGQFILMRGWTTEDPEEEAVRKESGPTYRLLLPRPNGGRAVSYNLTALTHEEFLVLKKFFLMVFDLVEPVVIQRDKVAQDAFAKGDDSFARIYRQVPQLVVREGQDGADDESVLHGPEDLPSGDGTGGGQVGDVRAPDGGVRGAGDELASGEPPASESQDDKP